MNERLSVTPRYVGGDDSNLHAVDAATGKLQWSVTVEDGQSVSSPVVSGGLVLVGYNTPWGVASPDGLRAYSV